MRLSFNSLLATAALSAFMSPAFAQLAPGPNPVTGTVGAQTLTGGTGTVSATGTISTTSAVAVTISGNSTLVNYGTIQATTSGRAIDNSVNNSNVTVTNNGLISANSTDAFRINTANTAVALTNNGTIRVTNGGQAIDWAAITSQSNVLTNNAGGVITAVGEDAVRVGVNGVVNNAGQIAATPTGGASPSGSDGIDIRRITGILVNNSGSISGRHGIATDGGSSSALTITVNNSAGGVISAINGSGLNIDGVTTQVSATVFNDFGGTFKGGVVAGGTDGDGDGIDVDGLLTLNNRGDVLGLGARGSNNAEGIAAGGGSIINTATGRIIGSSSTADAPNSDATRGGNGILIDDSNGGSAVAATTIMNDGWIQGKNGFGVSIVGTYADTVTNNAGGQIHGTGTSAVVQTGGGNDTLVNRGMIASDNTPGVGVVRNAVDLGDGDDQFSIEGGSASVIGDISGGTGNNTLTIAPGAGQSFTYAGSASNFSKVEITGGTVTLSGANTYTGATTISGGRLVLDGANRIAAASALVLNGGALEVTNAGGANGQTFASLTLADSSTLDLDSTTSLTFGALSAAAAGKTLSIVNWDEAASPLYAIRFVGDLSTSAAFLALISQTTVNGLAAAFYFDGVYTDIKAVPVPAAFGLLLSGLGLLGGAFRRRRATA